MKDNSEPRRPRISASRPTVANRAQSEPPPPEGSRIQRTEKLEANVPTTQSLAIKSCLQSTQIEGLPKQPKPLAPSTLGSGLSSMPGSVDTWVSGGHYPIDVDIEVDFGSRQRGDLSVLQYITHTQVGN